MPDDPLRGDDPLGGAEHEDVLLDGASGDDRSPAADAGSGDDADDEAAVPDDATSFVALDDRPTTVIPRVEVTPPAQSRWSTGLAPWAVFAAVAVLVVAATSTWAAWLQGPTADRQVATPRIQLVPTQTAPAPPTPEAVASPPEPMVEPEPEPEPEPAARPTQRRPTRAPAPRPEPPPPPAAAAADPETSGTPQPPMNADASPETADARATGPDAEGSDAGGISGFEGTSLGHHSGGNT